MMSRAARIFTCDNCGTTAAVEVVARAGLSTAVGSSLRLPRGWERYRALDPFSPVWCGPCVGDLLTSILDSFRSWSTRA